MPNFGRRCLSLIAVGLCGTAVFAQPDSAATPIDMEPLLKLGVEKLKKLPVLAPGDRRETYFEIHMGPDNPMGYVTASLEVGKDDDRVVYAYTSDTVMISKIGAQIRAKMEARLLPDFEPLEITMSRGNILEDKSSKFAGVHAVFGEENVDITSKAAGESATQPRPKPEKPYIFGIEMLAQLLDPSDSEPFALREYSANAGGAEPLRFSFETWRDGNLTLITRYSTGDLGYQFWFDQDKKLLRWTHVTMPVLFIRSTKERVAELRKKLGEPMPLEESAPANSD